MDFPSYQSFFDTAPDDIEFNAKARPAVALPQVIEEPSPVATPGIPVRSGGLLGGWRTHLNLPFPLFLTSQRRNPKQEVVAATDDSQYQRYSHDNTSEICPDSSRQHTVSSDQSVSTMIWSDPVGVDPERHAQSNTRTTSQAQSHSTASTHGSCPIVENDDEDFYDPLSPRLGSRAYRERERREMEKYQREQEEQ